jgi:nucleoside-diphosphate-sugar epimerase
MSPQRVLVTGGSGFIAGHCILQLLEQGYLVRTTVRSLAREPEVRTVLTDAGMTRGDALSFVVAELTSDDGWAAAVADCDYVLHVASPVNLDPHATEDEVVTPAREGALRVLKAAHDAGVKRVVLTSAFHAVGYGHPHTKVDFTEDDWSVLDGPGMNAYGRSKIAGARDHLPRRRHGTGDGHGDLRREPHHLPHPRRQMPGYPHLWIPIVHVRDVARAHILAMTAPEASGQRFLVSSGPSIPMQQIGAILRTSLGEAAKRVPTRSSPSFVVRLGGLFSAELRQTAPDLDYVRRVSSEKAARLLGWTARKPEEAIVAAGKSMVSKGLVAP